MECDALFAESDDEVVVLPPLPTTDTTVSSANEQIPKPLSSNCVNSTTPTRPYEVNVAPISHPSQSRTPVPEEYQPLPDSSSSNRNIRSNPINIRYQPKPQWSKNYCYTPSPYWEQRDALYFNNYILGNYNLQTMQYNPVSTYAIDSVRPRITRSVLNDNNPQRENELPPVNASSNQNATADVPPVSSDLASWLERPSRQLNISPGRRQSRESESNPIELSSEEEDNTPRKRQRDIGASCDNNPTNLSRNALSSINSRDEPRVTVKGEPHDLSLAAARSNVLEADMRRQRRSLEDAPLPLTTRRPSANQPIREPSPTPVRKLSVRGMNETASVHIKKENPAPLCHCGHNRMHGHVQTEQCVRPSPRQNNVNRIYPGHRQYHHHHHHHRNQGMSVEYKFRRCFDSSSSASSIPVQVKTEPRSENNNERPVKQESNLANMVVQSASLSDDDSYQMESMQQVRIKVEPERSPQVTEPVQEQVRVKAEPRNSREANERLIAKMEIEEWRRSLVDAGGDRSAASPQPGPSSGFVPVQPKEEQGASCQVNLTSILTLRIEYKASLNFL